MSMIAPCKENHNPPRKADTRFAYRESRPELSLHTKRQVFDKTWTRVLDVSIVDLQRVG